MKLTHEILLSILLIANTCAALPATFNTEFKSILQPSGEYKNNGFVLSTFESIELNSNIRVSPEGGLEHYYNDDNSFTGAYGRIQLDLIFDDISELSLLFGYHHLAKKSKGLIFDFRYEYLSPFSSLLISAGFRREIRYDSYIALAGVDRAGTLVGRARENQIYIMIDFDMNKFNLYLSPFLGWVHAASVEKNTHIGLETKLTFTLLNNRLRRYQFINYLSAETYAKDHSAITLTTAEPLPGGYFSPSLFLGESLQFEAFYQLSPKNAFTLVGGPEIHLVKDTRPDLVFFISPFLSFSYTRKLSSKLAWTTHISYGKVADRYIRFVAQTGLALVL